MISYFDETLYGNLLMKINFAAKSNKRERETERNKRREK